MNKPSFPLSTVCAICLLSGTVALVAAHAQHAAATPHRVAAARPVATPPLPVAPADSEENELSPPVDKGSDAAVAPGTPETTETEILATDGATFASKERIAVFTGNVRVTDPRFQLACDKLTVFLNKSANSDATGTPAAGGASATTPPVSTPAPLAAGNAPPGAAPSPTPGNSGGIDHAIAEGHVIIVQERAATPGSEAKRSVGRGDWANFDNKTGDMVLKGMPSVEQNENTHVATSPNTVMTLRKDNSLTTVGPSKTTIIQRKAQLPGGENGTPGAAQPSQGPAPASSAPPGRRTRAGSPAPTPASSSVRS